MEEKTGKWRNLEKLSGNLGLLNRPLEGEFKSTTITGSHSSLQSPENWHFEYLRIVFRKEFGKWVFLGYFWGKSIFREFSPLTDALIGKM